ncbi:MAG: pantetheine-phosphate adenylyltransferase [Flavobacteriales bacterium]|nr:pantetheine-phosphate adenylyltransferase [Flavobacteriales bacterium]
MKRIAVFPGSFDPITRGHQDLVLRASVLFDEIIVAIGHNTTKQTMFSLEQRQAWITATFAGVPNVRTDVYEGLTVDYCRKTGARFILRGLRNGVDFEYEAAIAGMNRGLNHDVETITLFTSPEWACVQSSIIREIIKNKGDVKAFVPPAVEIRY